METERLESRDLVGRILDASYTKYSRSYGHGTLAKANL